MNKSFLGNVITLDNNEKWYICDTTEQDQNTYYLAVKLDENDDPADESKIFKEVIENDKVYLDDKLDPETYRYLTAIFITNFSNDSEKIINDLNKEETI